MANITYLNKDKGITDGVRNKWRDVDANEVKEAVNSKADASELAAKANASDLATLATTVSNKQDALGYVPAPLSYLYISAT